MSQFSVRVKSAFEFNLARVGGMNFSKREPTLINAADLTDEIRNSPLLEVEPVAEPAAELSTQVVDSKLLPAEPVAPSQPPVSQVADAPVQRKRGKSK